MHYGKTKIPLTQTFNAACVTNAQIVLKPGKGEIANISEMINRSFSIAGHYVWVINMPHIAQINPVSKILLAAIHKNFISFCTVLELTRQGLYGPARTILRHIFEGLIVAKFCASNPDRKIFQRWEQGEYVALTNDVINKIKTPDTDPFRKLWKVLCAYTHATVYSQQAILDAKKNLDEIALTFQITRALLECNYHLLTQHFVTSSVQYFEKAYGLGHEVPILKKQLQQLFCNSHQYMFPPFNKFVITYRRKWTIR